MKLAGFAVPLVIYVGVFLLHVVLPARNVVGYVVDESTGKPLRYRLNGLAVLLVTVGIWWALGYFEILSWSFLWDLRWESLIGAVSLGLLFSFGIVARSEPVRASYFADFYFGRAKNPQFFGGRVDAKMYLYLVGATLLELHLLSFAAHHIETYAPPSAGVYLYVGLFSFFVLDYLTFERVHLYTYDLFAERVGFKLGWGCLAFYPYFYPVGLWAVADLPDPSPHSAVLVLATVVFFGGWMLARGANMQKFTFKLDSQASFLGMRPESIGDGERKLLCSGFWGVSRHVNYLGEILMATGLALSLGQPTSPWPWLYPLYYLVLLIPRERDDDRRCQAKYGELWTRYRQRVPYRIVPGIY